MGISHSSSYFCTFCLSHPSPLTFFFQPSKVQRQADTMTVLQPFLTGIIGATVSLQLLILANMSYLYGTAYRDSLRYSTMKLLYVDYDGGAIGQCVTTAYNQLKGPQFPTLHQHDQEDYPNRARYSRSRLQRRLLGSHLFRPRCLLSDS
ncbi:hypothetical protein BDW66DRAFT_123571 [Aspergillus desertorum]